MFATGQKFKIVSRKKGKRNRMLKSYEVAKLKDEYPGYEGEYRYCIYTRRPEEWLLAKFGKQLKKYEPYFVVSGRSYEVRVDATREEGRIRGRKRRHETKFAYEEGKTEAIHSEVGEEEILEILIDKERKEERKNCTSHFPKRLSN